MKPILFLLLFVSLSGAAQHSTAINDARQRADSLLKSIYPGNEPGIAIAVVENGKTIFKRNYGVTNLETKKAISARTNFNIGSLTKQFTAFAILQLAEKKKLSVDDHLSKFFPELNKKTADVITIKELLTHSSGLVDHYDLTDTKNMTHAHIGDVLNAIKGTDSTYFTPGTDFRYSNTAYCLLALVIERLSGLPYGEYLKRNLFIPCGMNHTSVWNEKSKIENEAVGYEFDSARNSFGRSGPDENIFFSTEGDGGIYTSIDDYLKWFAALQSGKKFSPRIVRQARSPQFVIDSDIDFSYGYGWFVTGPAPSIYHGGSNGGFRAYSFSIPAKNFLIVIFSNRTGIDLEKLVNQLYRFFAPK